MPPAPQISIESTPYHRSIVEHTSVILLKLRGEQAMLIEFAPIEPAFPPH